MAQSKMAPTERVIAALAGDDFDVYPVISPTPIATIDSMEMAKAFYPFLLYGIENLNLRGISFVHT